MNLSIFKQSSSDFTFTCIIQLYHNDTDTHTHTYIYTHKYTHIYTNLHISQCEELVVLYNKK